jgi:hypothetical protein
MDPNYAVTLLARYASDYRSAMRDGDDLAALNASDALAEQAEALTEWINRGGYVPIGV